MLPHRFEPDAPTPDAIKDLRERTRRTQAQVAQLLGITVRQFQRFESGEQTMPSSKWRLFNVTASYRHPVDFTLTETGKHLLLPILNGDLVHLQPLEGPAIAACVTMDRRHDGLSDEHSYSAMVIAFPDDAGAGRELGGFFIGERITFSRTNVVRLEQKRYDAA